MARNFVHDGERMTVVSPWNVNSGDVVIVGQMFGIAQASAASGSNVPIRTGGTHTLRKLNGASTSIAQGANCHWDNTNSNVTFSATSNTRLGVAAIAAVNADTVITVRLNPSF
jgi:predicted RecA/RadA family phage recombinase